MARRSGFWLVTITAAAGAVLGAGLVSPYVLGPLERVGYAAGTAIGGLAGFVIGLLIRRWAGSGR